MMLLFLAIIAGLVLLILAFILPALLRPKPGSSSDAQAEKRALYRQQFAELEQDRLNAVLDTSQYAIAKSELERRLLDEVGVTAVSMHSSQPDRRLALILLLLLPVAALLLYLKLGSVVSITQPQLLTSASGAQQAGERVQASDIEPLLQSLQKKLQMTPADGANWVLLGRSYVEIKRYPEAVKAFANAVKLLPNDAQLLADYADALAVVNNYQLTGLPEQLIQQALKIDPQQTKALMLAATAAFNRQDFNSAIGYWQRIEQSLPPDSALLPEVKAAITELRALFNKKTPAASADKVSSTAGISGTVRISPALAAKLEPSATLFVFARATQGPAMPLAIVRKLASDLPYRFQLDDSSALSPQNKLSQAAEVVLVARISKSGDAKPQAGDLQGMSAAVKVSGNTVDIEINQQLP
jgi:cytochrome c-type biogenesis protein CcmH